MLTLLRAPQHDDISLRRRARAAQRGNLFESDPVHKGVSARSE